MSTLDFMGRLLARAEAQPPALDRSHIMYRRCAWCGRLLGVVQTSRADLAGMRTDTMCEPCLAQVRAQPDRRAA